MSDPEAMKATINRYVERHCAGDIPGIVENFSATASVWDPVDTDPHIGSEALVAFFTGTHQMADTLILTITGPIRCAGNQAAFPMVAESHIGDMKLAVDIIDVMSFDDDGKIAEMRAYWSMADARALD